MSMPRTPGPIHRRIRSDRTPSTRAPRRIPTPNVRRSRVTPAAAVAATDESPKQAAGARIFVPSALTILAICAGLTAIRVAADGNVNAAMALVVTAAALDGLDGRVARMMGATSKLGAEIDSLADAINFGVVPALIVYLSLMDGHDVGWVLTLVYCCAVVLRLARFNTLLDDTDAPGYTRDFFVGVPAPAAAIAALLPIALRQQFGEGWWTSLPIVGAWLVIVGLLAISRVPTSSLKTASMPPRAAAIGLLLVVIGGALLFTFPYILLMVAIVAYLGHIPFAWRSKRWVQSRPEHWEDRPAERRAQRRAIARAQPRRRRIPVPGKSQARLGLRLPTGRSTNDTESPAAPESEAAEPSRNGAPPAETTSGDRPPMVVRHADRTEGDR